MIRASVALLATLTALVLAIGISQEGPTTAAEEFEWVEAGADLYARTCAGCHGPNGGGVVGAFPPLAGNALELFERDGGRELLIATVLHGLRGPITVGDATYDGVMPAWQHLSDTDLAAILNHVVWTLGDAQPPADQVVTPSEVSSHREDDLDPSGVWALRNAVLGLEVDAPAPAGATVVYNDDTGYYTLVQAERGEALYHQHCANCHGPTLRGGLHAPGITNLAFFRKWGGQSFDALFSFIATRMPLGVEGGLNPTAYVDIAAFWLSQHNYPAGEQPLVGDLSQLAQIIIERR